MREVERPAAKGRMLKRKVIGIFGNAQHGKNTVGRMLAEELTSHERRCHVFALADPLKRAAMELLGMPEAVAFGAGIPTEEREELRLAWRRYGRNAREWLQWVGTELGRNQIAKALWVDRAVSTVLGDCEGNEFFVITDCRFHTEYEDLRRKLKECYVDFITLRVIRLSVPVNMDHPSESEVAQMDLNLFDRVIYNGSTLDELRALVYEFVVSLGVE